MDELEEQLSELSQLQKDKYYYDSTYMKHPCISWCDQPGRWPQNWYAEHEQLEL